MMRSVAAANRARDVLPQARDAANQAALTATRAQAVADVGATLPLAPHPARTAARAAAFPWEMFNATFGATIANAARDTVLAPSDTSMLRLAGSITASDVSLNHILLFEGGPVLRAILEDQAYDGLAALAPTLESGTHGTSYDGRLGIGLLGPDRRNLFVGQLRNNTPHGVGIVFDRQGRGYGAGQWHLGEQHGIGHQHDALQISSSAGRISHGQLREGVRSTMLNTQRGFFEGQRLVGWAETQSVAVRARGFWDAQQMVHGELLSRSGETQVLFAVSSPPNEQALGQIAYRDGTSYLGTMRDSMRHGYGFLCFPSGELHAGLWRDNQLSGPGATVTAEGVSLGVWPGHGQPFARHELIELASPIDVFPAAL